MVGLLTWIGARRDFGRVLDEREKLVIANPVKAAATLCVDPIIDDLDKQHEQVDAEIARLQKVKQSFFGIERSSIQKSDEMISQLTTRKGTLDSVSKFANKYSRFHYREALKWRNGDGLPRLAVFDLVNPRCRLRVENNMTWERWKLEPKSLPWDIGHCFDDVFQRFDQRLRSSRVGSYCEIEAVFQGVIPDETRQKIEAAKSDFKDKLFILAEAPKWQVNQHFVPVPIGDPLVIGWDGKNCWLIDAFDTTPFEKYIKGEFTTTA